MGRIYKPVEVSYNGNKITTVGLVDTGADETVMTETLARELEANLYGDYRATCASGFLLTGKYALIEVKDLKTENQIQIEVGVSDIPFDTDEINEEGLGIILGVDFIQEVGLEVVG